MKMKKKLAILLALVLILTVQAIPVFAEDVQPENVVEPEVVSGEEVYFMDKDKNIISSYTRDGNSLYVRGEMDFASTVTADATFELMIDAKFAKPSIVATNVGTKSFVYEYDSIFGGYTWHYTSDVFWYFVSANKYLEVKTSTSNPGSHKAMVGSRYVMPDTFATSYLSVK
jgi:hypothetical protein